MKPLVFLAILLSIVVLGYIAYSNQSNSEILSPQLTQAPVQTDPPIVGVCNSGTPIYDTNGNLIRCECLPGTVGDKCEYTRNNSCNGGGNPVYDQETKQVSCSCEDGTSGDFCCNLTDTQYTERNTCSDNAICTPKGWKISSKTCDELKSSYKTDPNCISLCDSGVGISNLRCNSYTDDNGNSNAVVSCDNTSPYLKDSNPASDPFLQALYYPPDENDDILDSNTNWNKIFWEVLKTDRDLSELLSTNKQATRSQGNYGSFFKVYTFPDVADNTQITNQDLKNAIDEMFDQNKASFSFDNFGNITILLNGRKKVKNNPAFPYKEVSTGDNFTNCTDKRYGIDRSDGKCWQYFQNTDQGTYSPLNTAGALKLNNKNFITSTNKKWILYNNSEQPLYRLLYNPIHGKNFNNYFSPKDKDDRRNNILIQKYGEIAAQKNTYGISDRKYGDDSGYCFGGATSGKDYIMSFPDCVGYNTAGKKYFINPVTPSEGMKSVYDQLKGACACAGPSCSELDQIKSNNINNSQEKLRDSFLTHFQDDMKKYEFNISKNNGGACPASLSINICQNEFSSAGNTSFEKSNIDANCR